MKRNADFSWSAAAQGPSIFSTAFRTSPREYLERFRGSSHGNAVIARRSLNRSRVFRNTFLILRLRGGLFSA